MQVVAVPDGNYPGVWSGFGVTMTVNGAKVLLPTADALEGGIVVSVIVRGGWAEIEVG